MQLGWPCRQGTLMDRGTQILSGAKCCVTLQAEHLGRLIVGGKMIFASMEFCLLCRQGTLVYW